ncbi:MAG: hypothetical protein ACK559_05610, partial [bacterium]
PERGVGGVVGVARRAVEEHPLPVGRVARVVVVLAHRLDEGARGAEGADVPVHHQEVGGAVVAGRPDGEGNRRPRARVHRGEPAGSPVGMRPRGARRHAADGHPSVA